jgi:Fe-S cluster assembly protein SufD
MTLTPTLSTNAPQWFNERAAAAWQKYQDLPLPGLKDEPWRYSNAKNIPLEQLRPAATPSAAEVQKAIASSSELANTSARLVFVNDTLALLETSGLPAGAICVPFEQALRAHPELIQKHFMQRTMQLGSDKFAALHLAHVRAGTVIFVPKGVVVEFPIEVFHWCSGEYAAVFPHTLVITGDNAQVTVVDHYRSLGEDLGFCCAVTDLVGGPGSKLTYISCQEMSMKAQAMQLASTVAERDASVKSFQLQLGAAWSRSESVSDLVGKGSRSDMLSVSLPLGEQVVDQRTLQNHKAPNSQSDLLYKNALYDKSRSIFGGLITVDESAHYTDAFQTCRNLMNSPDAEANSMPGLEINADQVKCSHGSTSGPVSNEELFYLKARGIPDHEARKLIVLGFADDVIGRIGNEEIQAMIHARVEEKFAQVG